MHSVVVVEVLRYLRRRDLDKLYGFSEGLNELMALACETYPFRLLQGRRLRTFVPNNDVPPMFDVCIEHDRATYESFKTLDEALAYFALFFRSSYVDKVEVHLGLFEGNYRISPAQWSVFKDTFLSGAARHIWFHFVDFSIVDSDAFVNAVRCSKLEVSWCDFRGGLLWDDVLNSCSTNGIVDLQMCFNKSEGEHTVLEDVLLKFCFPLDGTCRAVQLDNLTTTSDTFVGKFFQRVLATEFTSVPRGFLVFTSKQEQRGLADYAKYLVEGQASPTYRFPERLNGAHAYHFVSADRVLPALGTSHMEFSFGYMDLRPTNNDRLDVDDDGDDEEDMDDDDVDNGDVDDMDDDDVEDTFTDDE